MGVPAADRDDWHDCNEPAGDGLLLRQVGGIGDVGSNDVGFVGRCPRSLLLSRVSMAWTCQTCRSSGFLGSVCLSVLVSLSLFYVITLLCDSSQVFLNFDLNLSS